MKMIRRIWRQSPFTLLILIFITGLWTLFIEKTDAQMHWLSVASVGTAPINPQECVTLQTKAGFNRRQVKVCRKNLEHMKSVQIGAIMAIEECQYQFKYRRWNCSTIKLADVQGTRESAFVHSISAAGVAHTVTKDCSRGSLEKCGCDYSHQNDDNLGFRWAGCSDNIHYGIAFSRQFVDAHERRKKQAIQRMYMNLHNNEAGRMVKFIHGQMSAQK